MTRQQYHHGALRDALLESAERILRKEGLNALTLRAIARDAKVSHAAPAHHFRDLTDLLSELAAVGFQRLGRALQSAIAASPEPRSAARAYVGFAVKNSALFQLMFRGEKLDRDNVALRTARFETLRFLGGGGQPGTRGTAPPTNLARVGAMTASWSLVHGFAMLLIDGPLAAMLRLAPEGTDAMALLDASLDAVSMNSK